MNIIPRIAKKALVGTLLVGSATSAGVVAKSTTATNVGNATEIISKEGAKAIKASKLYTTPIKYNEIKEQPNWEILLTDKEYQKSLDTNYNSIFGTNETLSTKEVFSKDKKIAEAIKNIDDNGLINLEQIISINNPSYEMDETEYKLLRAIADFGIINDENFNTTAFTIYNSIQTQEKKDFDIKAVFEERDLLYDLDQKYDKHNSDDVAKLISKYYYGTKHGSEIIDKWLGAYDSEINEIYCSISSNGARFLPYNKTDMVIAVNPFFGGEIRIKEHNANNFRVYDWKGDYIESRNDKSMLY